MQNILKFGLCALLIIVLGCGQEKDIDKIGAAQFCLDGLGSSPSVSEVNDCIDKVSGIETSGAYGIRCAGSFIKEGFADPKKYVNAFKQLDGNSTTGFMGLLTFTSAKTITTDTTNARDAFNSCLKSEGKGATMISAFGYVAMALYNFMFTNDATSCPNTRTASGYDLAGCITAFTGNVANAASLAALGNASTGNAAASELQSSIGSVIISTYNISCTTGVGANKSLCDTFKTAITNGGGQNNPRGVAVQFILAIGIQ